MEVSTSISAQACVVGSVSSVRRRKPAITYQSPGSGLVDMGLLARNTGLEAVAAASMFRHVETSSSASAISPPLRKSKDIPLPSQDMLTRLNPTLYRPLSIPRPPPRLYHTLAHFGMGRPLYKRSTSTASLNSQGRTLDSEPERRSSSRARRPAPKVRDIESAMESLPEPLAKRKRGGRRRRTAAQQEADDSAYAGTKRPRKSKETDVDGDGVDASPYSTRARKPRLGRAGSSTSDRSESLATPLSGGSAKTT